MDKKGNNELRVFLLCDETSGILATRNIYNGKTIDRGHGTVSGNYDCIRHGTLSLLTGIDLVIGHII